MKEFSLLALLVTLVFTSLASASGAPPRKKLIEYGWDVPSTRFVREHIAEMERLPFDGVVIKIMPDARTEDNLQSLGWRIFSKTRIKPDEYEHAIADLKATKFSHFTDNFAQVIAMPGDVDWFDKDWSVVAANAACLARVAKLGGCKGIMFDPEHYNSDSKYRIWDYKSFAPEMKAAHTLAEYQAKVKERGREFIRAVNKEYPDITILTLYGASLPYVQSDMGKNMDKGDYGLLLQFYEGMSEAASPGTIIIDGFEFSYGYRNKAQFEDSRKIVLEGARSLFTDKKAFDEHFRAGFGIWADCSSHTLGGWHADDFSKNHFTPEAFRTSVAYALELSDEYVWIYSERLSWWKFDVPSRYVYALAEAKRRTRNIK